MIGLPADLGEESQSLVSWVVDAECLTTAQRRTASRR